MTSSQNNQTEWQNRIVRYGVMAADQFTANPRNPRRHPQAQRDAVKGSLDTPGFIAPVIVNRQTGYLIDGHERVMQALGQGDETPVPFIEVDLSEDEETLALTTFDWITQLAYYDRDNLSTLLDEIDTDNQALQALLSEMAQEHGVIPPDFDPRDEWVGMPEFEQEERKAFREIRVEFNTQDYVDTFARLIGQTITDKTTMIYFPARPKRQTGVYVDGDYES